MRILLLRLESSWILNLCTVVKDYDSDLANVETFSRQVNQVRKTGSHSVIQKRDSIEQVKSGPQEGNIIAHTRTGRKREVGRMRGLSVSSIPSRRASSATVTLPGTAPPTQPVSPISHTPQHSPNRSRTGTFNSARSRAGSAAASRLQSISERLQKINTEVTSQARSWLEEHNMSPLMRTQSPDRMFDCHGNCSPPDEGEPPETADVISLSSCKDSQLSWEESSSMTEVSYSLLFFSFLSFSIIIRAHSEPFRRN